MRIVGMGAGGHAKVLLDAVLAAGEHEVIGLLAREGTAVLGIPVLGGDDLLPSLGVAGAFLGVGDLPVRRRLCERVRELELTLISVLHPRATLARSARFGPGLALLAQAVINPDAQLGMNVIVNTGAIVEHDCQVGDHVHVAPRALLCGGVRVGENTHVGAGAVVREGITLGRDVVVGAGAVVVRDVPDGQLVVGIPARTR